MSNDLATFLLARISDDEELAREALARASVYGDREVSWKWLRSAGGNTMWEPTNHDPTRVLAECAAKRRIVTEVVPDIDDLTSAYADATDAIPFNTDYPSDVLLRLLAFPYADHPDYDPAWRPEQTA